jgi:hypothetical protein
MHQAVAQALALAQLLIADFQLALLATLQLLVSQGIVDAHGRGAANGVDERCLVGREVPGLGADQRGDPDDAAARHERETGVAQRLRHGVRVLARVGPAGRHEMRKSPDVGHDQGFLVFHHASGGALAAGQAQTDGQGAVRVPSGRRGQEIGPGVEQHDAGPIGAREPAQVFEEDLQDLLQVQRRGRGGDHLVDCGQVLDSAASSRFGPAARAGGRGRFSWRGWLGPTHGCAHA